MQSKRIQLANEDRAFYLPKAEAWADKARFVSALAVLLEMTREGVVDLALSEDGEKVTIIYDGGFTRPVNIACDSYVAIILDVTKEV